MPLLQFTCASCGKPFEELVKRGREEEVRCPDCQSREVRRRYQGPCSFGSPRASGGSSSCSCGGSCGHCSHCGH